MISNIFAPVISLFYPPVCAVCSADVASTEYLCATCRAKAPRISAPFCAKCSEPFFGAIDRPFECRNCAGQKLHFEAAVAAYLSRGVVREVVHQFKYNHHVHLRHVMADWLCTALEDSRLAHIRFDLIVPVPLHSARQRERGFNQAALLAKLLARRTSIPCRSTLKRIRYTTTQTAFDRAERMENLHNAFRLRKKADVRGLQVLLIDDVLTTGSTLNECARVLRHAGAASVFAAVSSRA